MADFKCKEKHVIFELRLVETSFAKDCGSKQNLSPKPTMKGQAHQIEIILHKQG